MTDTPLLEVRDLHRFFGTLVALHKVSATFHTAQITCLLGDNGAGKSTLIKILSGLDRPDSGEMLIEGETVRLNSPREAFDRGIATVYQDLAVLPDMSIDRNFVLGMEPYHSFFGIKVLNRKRSAEIATEELSKIGIEVRDTNQLVGTMSGGERQSLAIARAEYRGAKALILDEPTAALGVKEAAIVLRHILHAKDRGLAVIFITHNVRHALTVGDKFVVLNRGEVQGTFDRDDVDERSLSDLMGGGEEFYQLRDQLQASRGDGHKDLGDSV